MYLSKFHHTSSPITLVKSINSKLIRRGMKMINHARVMNLGKTLNLPLRSKWAPSLDMVSATLWWPTQLDNPRAVFLMIPGNPGIADFYDHFLSYLYLQTDKALDIVAINHLGFSQEDDQDRLYTLEEQIEHADLCLKELAESYPPNTPIIICSHSIGSFISEKIVENNPELNIVKVIQLFPTLQHIKKSRNGQLMHWSLLSSYGRYFTKNMTWLVSQFPHTLTKPLVKLFTGMNDHNATIVVDKLLKAPNVNNALYMASDEMEKVLDCNYSFYEQNASKFVFYFGTEDHWVPMEQYLDLKTKVPSLDIILCKDKLRHGFCVDENYSILGDLVTEWVNASLPHQ